MGVGQIMGTTSNTGEQIMAKLSELEQELLDACLFLIGTLEDQYGYAPHNPEGAAAWRAAQQIAVFATAHAAGVA